MNNKNNFNDKATLYILATKKNNDYSYSELSILKNLIKEGLKTTDDYLRLVNNIELKSSYKLNIQTIENFLN